MGEEIRVDFGCLRSICVTKIQLSDFDVDWFLKVNISEGVCLTNCTAMLNLKLSLTMQFGLKPKNDDVLLHICAISNSQMWPSSFVSDYESKSITAKTKELRNRKKKPFSKWFFFLLDSRRKPGNFLASFSLNMPHVWCHDWDCMKDGMKTYV